ncbi:MAG: topoisomerase C-terminal repeat-containing protein [Oscillospiraceae bacterium]|nr:topoisomerase C-terminal repeat-containing protein [Oscillospiraceae bacterium]
MILIIAEKPSLARNIAGAIGGMNKRGSYFENREYIVTWAYGHLFTLCDIEDYTGGEPGAKWKMDSLPCFPNEFRFKLRNSADKKPDEGAKRQFGVIKELCERADVETIVNAGDADREGEIIIRLIVMNTLAKDKPFMRLWLPDQTDETIISALSQMKSESEYDNLSNEGFARTYIDWLYGVNLTRMATVKSGTLLRVGRVIVPIVKAIYDRDKAIENFIPEKYLALESKAETNSVELTLVSKYKFGQNSLERALLACERMNEAGAEVTSVKTKNEKLNPGKLYSLSKLQNFLGKKYKMPMDESLAVIQKLYEEGYVTYPRTNSEYLATAEKDKVKRIIGAVQNLGYPVKFVDKKTIFDDSKIESHSALTPTYKIPDASKLTEKEKLVYSAVLRRFVMVFCSEDCIAKKTELQIKVGKYEDFTVKGTVILEPGWTRFDDSPKAGKLLPDVKKGDKINIAFAPKEKETSPPKHYTIETLNNYLKNPFRDEKKAAENEDDAEEYKAVFEGLELGTEATRTGIIGNAVSSRYIDLKKDVYRILPGGEYLIESLIRMNISMDKYKTSELGKALKAVYRGDMSVQSALELAKAEIYEVFSSSVNDPESVLFTGAFGDPAGICPVCGREVKKGRYAFRCEGHSDGCETRIPTYLCKREISLREAQELLQNGKTEKLTGFISKQGKGFDAALKLENGQVKFAF